MLGPTTWSLEERAVLKENFNVIDSMLGTMIYCLLLRNRLIYERIGKSRRLIVNSENNNKGVQSARD